MWRWGWKSEVPFERFGRLVVDVVSFGVMGMRCSPSHAILKMGQFARQTMNPFVDP